MPVKLHYLAAGPPSLAVLQALKYLQIPYELIEIDYDAGEHITEEYALKNPQKEVPVLEDHGFFLSESNAILQYLCDKYRPDSNIYPREPALRALVNHRLCFNLSTYYRYICEYALDPHFYESEKTPLGLKKVTFALVTFNEYLRRTGKKYVVADHLTIADFQLFIATMCLNAIPLDFSQYEHITKWYTTFKSEYPDLWAIAEVGLNILLSVIKNPVTDLSQLEHPYHQYRKIRK